MSSMLLSPQHFNSVESGIKELVWDKKFYFDQPITKMYPELKSGYKIPLEKKEKTISSIVDELRKLSVRCFHLQYTDHFVNCLDLAIEEQMNILLSCKKQYEKLNLLGLHKAAFCLEYQINIEHLEELRPLTEKEKNAYAFSKYIQQNIARHIVQHLDGYEDEKYSI